MESESGRGAGGEAGRGKIGYFVFIIIITTQLKN